MKASHPKQLIRAGDYRTLRNFRAFEVVNAMRLSMALDTFKTLTAFGSIALVAVVTLVFVVGMSILRDGPLRNDLTAVLELGFLAILYSAVVLVLSETISNRRLAVAGSPHLELFRAMELPIQQVVLRYAVIPALRRLGLLWYSSAVFFLVFFEAAGQQLHVVLWAVTALTLTTAACLFAVVRFASVPARRVSLRWPVLLLVLVLGVTAGGLTAALASRWGRGEVSGIDAGLVSALCLAGLAGSALVLALTSRGWRRLGYGRILVQPARKMAERPVAGFSSFVLSDLFCSRHGSVISTLILAWTTLVGFLLGGDALLPFKANIDDARLHQSLIGLTVILTLSVTEPMLYRIGPTAKMYHFRFAWENGSPLARMVICLSGTYLLFGGVIGFLVFCCAFLALGASAPGTILAGGIVAAAGVVGETLSRPPVSTDGTKSTDIMDALYTLLLIAPCSLILVLSPGHSTLLLLGYCLVLTLGVFACLRIRVLKIPLNSNQ